MVHNFIRIWRLHYSIVKLHCNFCVFTQKLLYLPTVGGSRMVHGLEGATHHFMQHPTSSKVCLSEDYE